jgi:hypothetical protein
MPLVHDYNSSYLGGWDWEKQGSKPVQENSSLRTHLQKNQSKKG